MSHVSMASAALQQHLAHFGRALTYRAGVGAETTVQAIVKEVDPEQAKELGLGLEDLVNLRQITMAAGAIPEDDPDARLIDGGIELALHVIRHGEAGELRVIAGEPTDGNVMRL